MRRSFAVLPLLLAGLVVAPGAAAAPAAPELAPVSPPSPFTATDGRRHLVYELVLTNPTAASAAPQRLEVRDAGGAKLQVLDAAAIADVLVLADTGASAPAVPAGGTALLFLDVASRPGWHAPRTLAHRLRIRLDEAGRPPRTVVLDHAATETVRPGAAVVLSRPLRGPHLVDVNGCCFASAHRVALIPLTDRLVAPERFAIDFVRGDPALTTTWEGDPTRNASYFLWDADVLAAAPGTVVAVRDDVVDGTPPLAAPEIGFDDLAGNHVVEDLGGGRFALYAHLRHGSVRVRVGDVVARGAVLGHVGNSGNSDEPHLHFHVMDAAGGPSALEADGLPYVFDAFQLEGRRDDAAGPGPLEPLRPGPRTGALPLAGEAVDFG